MANLRVNKITGTEVFETTGSVQFDGSGDYLSLASNNDFDFSSGSFTIEAWVYPKSLSADVLIVTSNTTGGFFFGRRNLGAYIGYGRLDTAWDNSSGNDLVINQWNHVAVCRDSNNNIRVFLNGIQSGLTQTLSTSYNLNTLTIGGTTSGYFLNGHISNLRILKGTALYTKNFTPPTRELTVIPNTVLLACQHKTDASHEKTGKTITVNGNTVANELTPGLLTDVVKSGGSSAITGSVEFDGTGDYLVPTGSDFGLSSSEDFTLEMWIHATSFDNSSTYSEVIRQGTNNAATDGMYLVALSAGTIEWRLSGTTKTSTNKMTAGSWNHIAVCRASGTVYISVNGLTENFGSVTNSSTTSAFRIGANFEGNQFFEGHLSNVRFVKGTALYTSNFIPPTRELKKIPGTVLLCCQSSTNPLQEETGKTISLNGSVTTYSVGIGTTTPNPRNFAPQVSSDGSVTFGGVTKINTPNYFYLPTGNTEQRFPNFAGVDGGGRGLFAGSNTEPASGNTIEYITISSTGNTKDFGDRIGLGRRQIAAVASPTRAVFAGSYSPLSNIIDYVTIASTGNAQDFGDTTTNLTEATGISNSTRGIFAGGRNPTVHNVIQYVTIQSTGNSIDFGDLIISDRRNCGSCQSPTRGIIAGGRDGGGTDINLIDYITISTTGNSIDFGDLVSASHGREVMGGGNSTRGIFAGGNVPSTNVISYITIASTGNAQDFGDNTAATSGMNTMACSSTRACMFGANVPARTLSYVTIQSTGDAIDFGDFTVEPTSNYYSGCSDSHGGLG